MRRVNLPDGVYLLLKGTAQVRIYAQGNHPLLGPGRYVRDVVSENGEQV